MVQSSGGAAEALSSGIPSEGLAQALGAEQSGGYEQLTEAASERGIFQLVGGYLDDDQVVHREIQLRSMTGDEEDMLGNRSIPILDRMASILGSCTERLGTITEPGKIALAISRMPLGTRTHAVICLRRVTHWKRTKDIYEMDVRCPIQGCEKIGNYEVNLAELELYDMPHPEARVYEVKLTGGDVVTWRVAAAAQERVLSAVGEMEEKRILTFAILVRLETLNGQDVRLGIADLLTGDGKKIKLSKRAELLFNTVRKWSSGDREDVRADILNKEPSVDTELEFECSHCHKPFSGSLDIGQETFFFPSATYKRSKAKPST